MEEYGVRKVTIGNNPLAIYVNSRIAWIKRRIRAAAAGGWSDGNSQARLHELLDMKARLAGGVRWEGAIALKKQEVIKRVLSVLNSIRAEDLQAAERDLTSLLLELESKQSRSWRKHMERRKIRFRAA